MVNKMTINMNAARSELDDDASQGGFLVPFTLEQFRNDILWLFILQAKLIAGMFNTEAAMRFLGKPDANAYVEFDEPTTYGLSYADISHSWLAISLEAMYRYGYHGEVDERIEVLGPGGYHIGIAAIVKDMAESSLQKFCMMFTENDHRMAIENCLRNCLRTAELANARLTLEGEPRFFNFDSKDECYDKLVEDDTSQGGYGAALTIRQLALLSGMGEASIRTAANPKRPRHIPTETRSERTVVAIDVAKDWLKKKNRYVPIRRCMDGVVLDLIQRKFSSTHDLYSIVLSRLAVLDDDTALKMHRLNRFKELGARYNHDSDIRAAYSNQKFVRELADVLEFPPDLFVLRVREVLLDAEIKAVRRAVFDVTQGA